MKITFKNILYWVLYIGYLYIIVPSSLFKIFQRPAMMQSMESLGFNKTWTLAIGIAEVIGVVLVILGLYRSQFRTIGILFLFPFAIGAFTTHMAHQEYHHYGHSLIMCCLSAILLFLDNRIKINLSSTKKL
ncbi:DoxX family protein [Chryseobacterium sp. JV274]|uniref:DoxX family protein n=1 Tax=unclassified Chryseobacterium TaxID=2593645 RepID=UPI0009843C5D|nr:DoxX family protein [Chryseobacterium sp. JV274]CAD0218685.1 membrane protein of unknown function [Chryseobacterium sp. JV274]